MTTAQELLRGALAFRKETPQDLIAVFYHPNPYRDPEFLGASWPPPPEIKCTFDSLPTYEFDSGFGSQEGPTIRAYTANYVYFTQEYDGSECVASIQRNP